MSLPNDGRPYDYEYERRYSNGQPPAPPQSQRPHPYAQTSQEYHVQHFSENNVATQPSNIPPQYMTSQQVYQVPPHMHQQNQNAYYQQGQYNAINLASMPSMGLTDYHLPRQETFYHSAPLQQFQQSPHAPQTLPPYNVQKVTYSSTPMQHRSSISQEGNHMIYEHNPQFQSTTFIKSESAPEVKHNPKVPSMSSESHRRPSQPRKISSGPQYDGTHAIKNEYTQTSSSTTSHQIPHPQKAPVLNSKSLICLAEEFFLEAHKLVDAVSLPMESATLNIYQKLIATGLGCLETCLLNLDLEPRTQALIRLRLAAVMSEETQNPLEVESCLAKGIKLCDQHKFFDLQYSMTFLQIKTLFKTSAKAALKQLDIAINNAELYRHYSWIYALRFLRVELSLKSETSSTHSVALLHLQHIESLSLDRGDRSIHATAALVEAVTHLSLPGIDNIEHANRALASARTYQLDHGDKIPHLIFLMHCVDVVCSFLHSPAIKGDTPRKLRAMQLFVDASKDDQRWNPTRCAIKIPVITDVDSSRSASSDSRAIIDVSSTGQHLLVLSYLGKQDAVAFTNLLSGIVQMQNKDYEKSKASKYLSQTHILAKDKKRTNRTPASLPVLSQSLQWRSSMSAYAHIHQAFCSAIRTQWSDVQSQLLQVERLFPIIEDHSDLVKYCYLYLTGVYQQGIGNLDAALAIYSHNQFAINTSERSSLDPRARVIQDLCILALLNRISIMQDPAHADILTVTEYIEVLDPFCANHPNHEIRTALDILKATIQTNPPTAQLHRKNFIGSALPRASASSNALFMSVLFNVMCTQFFQGVLGDQAHKSAQTATLWSDKSQNKLWMSVAEGLLAGNHDTNGKVEDAQAARQRGTEYANAAFIP